MSKENLLTATSALADLTGVIAQFVSQAHTVSLLIQMAQSEGRDLTAEELDTVFHAMKQAIDRLHEVNQQG